MTKTTAPDILAPDLLAPVREKADSLITFVEMLDYLGDHVRPLPQCPAGADEAKHQSLLLDFFQRFGVNRNAMYAEPLRQTAKERFGYRFRNDDSATEMFHQVLMSAELNIDNAVRRGIVDDRLVRTDDFGHQDRIQVFGDETWYVVCSLSSLAEGHPLRKRLPEETELFKTDYWAEKDTGKPALVLGLPVSTITDSWGPPRPYYWLESTLNLTAAARKRQLAAHKEAVEQKRHEEDKKKEAFWESEVGKYIIAKREFEQLERAGKIPEEVLAEFKGAVRQGAGFAHELGTVSKDELEARLAKRTAEIVAQYGEPSK